MRPLPPAGVGIPMEIAVLADVAPDGASASASVENHHTATAIPLREPEMPPLPDIPVMDIPAPAFPVPDTPIIPNEKAEPLIRPAETTVPEKNRAPQPARQRASTERKPQTVAQQPAKREPRITREYAAPAANAGIRQGQGQGGSGQAPAGRAGAGGAGMSAAGYAAQVRGILQARANRLGMDDVAGTVAIAFQIDAQGRVSSHAITRTSGVAEIDRAVRGMMGSVSFPPPPGGRFAVNVTVRVQ